MRRLTLFAIILLVSVWVGVKIAQDPGYVLIAHQHWTMEMPLWFAFVAFFVAFFALYTVVRLWRNFRTIPLRWQIKAHQRYSKKLKKLSNESLLALSTGNWSTARRKLAAAANYSRTPWLYYLASAFAANKMQNPELRDTYLQKATKTSAETKIAVGLLQAQFQANQKPIQSITILEHLHQIAPKQPYVLRLLAQAYEKLKDWHNLLALLPSLYKYNALDENSLTKIEVIAYQGYLQSAEYNNAAGLQAIWKKIPRRLYNNPALLSTYLHLLIAKGATKEAEEQLRETLAKNWDHQLILLYGFILSKNPDQQLATAEKWLLQHKNDATLLFVLGHLSARNQLWGKARDYLEASINIEPKQETYLELGRLLEQLHEDPAAIIQCYKKGLQCKTTLVSHR